MYPIKSNTIKRIFIMSFLTGFITNTEKVTPIVGTFISFDGQINNTDARRLKFEFTKTDDSLIITPTLFINNSDTDLDDCIYEDNVVGTIEVPFTVLAEKYGKSVVEIINTEIQADDSEDFVMAKIPDRELELDLTLDCPDKWYLSERHYYANDKYLVFSIEQIAEYILAYNFDEDFES